MNKFLNDFPFKQTIITIIITVIIIFAIATALQLSLLFKSEKKVNFEELNVQNLAKFLTIEQLENAIRTNPSDKIASLRLAILYDDLNDVNKANYYYKNSLNLSERSNYSLYVYAMFLAKHEFINLSTTLAEEIDKTGLKNYEYKSKIYERIADQLMQTKDYEAANKAYQVSYKYAQNINNKKYEKSIANKYAQSYINMADDSIEQKDIEQAEFLLKRSFKIRKLPLASYKLGLLLKDENLHEAQRLINYAFQEDPYIVNPYIYKKVLDDCYNEANYLNESDKINLYATLKKEFNKTLLEKYLFTNDIDITSAKIVKEKEWLNKNKIYFINYDIKNNTNQNIDQLYLLVKLTIGDKSIDIPNKAITPRKPLVFDSSIENQKIELPKDLEIINLKNANDVVARFYARKDTKAPWTLIKIKQLYF